MILLAGCGYRAGSLLAIGPHGQAASVQTVGCLDVAVVPIVDGEAAGPVAGYRFANRCDRPLRIDLGAARVTGIFPDGKSRVLRVFDPNGQIRPGTLDARAWGKENLEYELSPESAPPTQLCIDLSRLNASARGAGPKVQVCIAAFVNHAPNTELARR